VTLVRIAGPVLAGIGCLMLAPVALMSVLWLFADRSASIDAVGGPLMLPWLGIGMALVGVGGFLYLKSRGRRA
jgi:hypothetical protein